MSPLPLVSVVVPTFQRAALLAETLRSALAQTHARIEVLVEDDGSTDGSDAVVAGIGDARLRYGWQPNRGYPAPARNRGIARARGELIAFLDSDDLWDREKLAVEIDAFGREPDLLVVSCDARWLPPRQGPLLRLEADVRPSFDELLAANVVLNSGAVVRREVFEAVGLLDEAPDLAAVEDYDLWLRVLRHRDRSIRVLRTPLFHYRASADAVSVGGRRELERIRRALAKHEDFRPDAVRDALARRERRVRRGELQAGLRAGTVSLPDWLRAAEVPLRRRLRMAARALLLGRRRA